MTSTRFLTPGDLRCVEPVQRMRGGSFGWVVHRFPIKGGKTLRETVHRAWGEALTRAAAQPSYFARLLAGEPSAPVIRTDIIFGVRT